MADIVESPVTVEELGAWYDLKRELGQIKSKEALLRSRVFRWFFKTPVEGTNKHEIGDGTGAIINATHVINRGIDVGALDALKEVLRAKGIPVDKLIAYKPELVLSAYRELTAEEMKLFDQVLIIKPGSPQVDIVIPKKPKAG